jgi:hypothetical protein
MLPGFLLACCAISLFGCKPDPGAAPSHIEKLRKDLETTLNDTRKTIESLGPRSDELQKSATEEVEKLFTFEYHVAEFPIEEKKDVLNDELAKLGKERWDCFHIEPRKEVIRLYCKRRPKSYLRYIPKVL